MRRGSFCLHKPSPKFEGKKSIVLGTGEMLLNLELQFVEVGNAGMLAVGLTPSGIAFKSPLQLCINSTPLPKVTDLH